MTTETTTETRSHVGPYEILSTLGRGGMGVVYLGEHPDSGEKLAIKTLLSTLSSHVRGLRQEIAALREHGHPHIIRVVEDGVSDGIPWYAMEVLQGRTLDAVLADRERRAMGGQRDDHRETTVYRSTGRVNSVLDPVAETVIADSGEEPADDPLSFVSEMAETGASRRVVETIETLQGGLQTQLDDERPVFRWEEIRPLLRWIGHVAKALSYLHERCVVHRDLKPSNIFVTHDARAVLMDFGLAIQQEERVLAQGVETAGLAAGTALYMSPEVIQGRRYDARSDLYSLGCMVYEVIAGRPPFVDNSLGKIIHAHVFLAPQPLDDLVEGVPEPLSDLAMRLLEKDPTKRVPYAQSVLQVLAALGVQDAEVTWEHVPQIYRSSLMGRERLTAAVAESLHACRRAHRTGEAQVQFVVLEGASGVGKSRLVVETGRVANHLGYRIFSGGCQTIGDGRTGRPLHPWVEMVRKIIDESREHGWHARDVFGEYGRALAPYVPFLDEMPGLQDLLPAADLSPEAACHRLFEVLAHALRRVAEKSPLLVVIDDLQWADELTLGALRHLQGRLEHSCVFLMTVRSEVRTTYLTELYDLACAQVHRVERLPRAAMVQMIDEMLGGLHDAEAIWELIGPHAAGNPFFLEESVRHLVASEVLRFSGTSTWHLDVDASTESVVYPETLEDLVAARISRLGREIEEIVRMASVLGRTFSIHLLALALERPLVELQFGELIRRDVLEWHGAEAMRFTHDKLVELLYADVASCREERVRLHGCVAQAYETVRASGEPIDLGRLARHLEQGDRVGDARVAYLDAFREATARNAYQAAESLLADGLRLTDEDDALSLSATVHFANAVLMYQGRMTEAEDRLNGVLDNSVLERSGHAHAAALCALGNLFCRTGRMEESLAVSEEARKMACALGDRHVEQRAYGQMGLVHKDRGHYAEALIHLDTALEIARELSLRRAECVNLGNIGLVHQNQGRFDEALVHFERTLEIAVEVGDRRNQANSHGGMAGIHLGRGRYAQALIHFGTALEIAREVGDRRNEGVWFANIGLVHCNQGRYPEALEHYELALEIAREVGDRRSEGAVLCNAAGVYLDRGQYEHALNQYRLANAIAREVGNQRGEGQSLGNMGSVYLEQGRFGEAMDHYKAARKILGEAGDEYAGYWRTYVGRAERMIGAVDDARTTQEECLSLLRDIGIQAALGECLCERGHLRLHAGEDAVAELSEARAIAAELGVQPTTALGKAVDRLTRAAEAQSRGETLYYGQCLDDYPEGVRDALRRS